MVDGNSARTISAFGRLAFDPSSWGQRNRAANRSICAGSCAQHGIVRMRGKSTQIFGLSPDALTRNRSCRPVLRATAATPPVSGSTPNRCTKSNRWTKRPGQPRLLRKPRAALPRRGTATRTDGPVPASFRRCRSAIRRYSPFPRCTKVARERCRELLQPLIEHGDRRWLHARRATPRSRCINGFCSGGPSTVEKSSVIAALNKAPRHCHTPHPRAQSATNVSCSTASASLRRLGRPVSHTPRTQR